MQIFFGYFDYLTLVILIFLNIKFWKEKADYKMGCFVGGLLFGFILPLISMLIELEIVKSNGGWLDSFEVSYTLLKFPTYWIIGILQAIVTGVKMHRQNC